MQVQAYAEAVMHDNVSSTDSFIMISTDRCLLMLPRQTLVVDV